MRKLRHLPTKEGGQARLIMFGVDAYLPPSPRSVSHLNMKSISINISQHLNLTVLVHGKAREVHGGVRTVESSHEVCAHGKALQGAVRLLPPAIAIQRSKGAIADLRRAADTGGKGAGYTGTQG